MIRNVTNITLHVDVMINSTITTTPTAPVFTTLYANVTAVSSYCCPDSNLTFETLNSSSTTDSLIEIPDTNIVTESVHKRKIWTQDEYGSYVPYDEQYTTPTSILLLNFFLVIFLMIVIGIAVYPAVKKYCDSTFYGNGTTNRRYWIDDNEEVISVLTSNIPQCSFALLNSNRNVAATVDDSSSTTCSLEGLT